MENGKPTKRDLFWIFALLALTLTAVCCYTGCGNSAAVKPKNELANDVKTSLKNDQEMRESIEQLNGQLTKIQQNISEVVTTITTVINQKFETLQGSTKTGDIEGGAKISQDTNSMWYGIGLVAVVLVFVLILIWVLAKVLKEAALKILK